MQSYVKNIMVILSLFNIDEFVDSLVEIRTDNTVSLALTSTFREINRKPTRSI